MTYRLWADRRDPDYRPTLADCMAAAGRIGEPEPMPAVVGPLVVVRG